MRPTDSIEEIWVRDFVDLTWDIFRLREVKTALLEAAVSNAINCKVMPFVEFIDANGSGPGHAPAAEEA